MATVIWHGYAACPVAYGNTVIVTVGGADGNGILAFDQSTGDVTWSSATIRLGYASPVLINTSNDPSLVVYAKDKTLALTPADGRIRWEIGNAADYTENAGDLPLWLKNRGLLWTSVRGWQDPVYDGTRVFRIGDSGTNAEIAWEDRKQRVESLANGVIVDDVIYAAFGYGRHAKLSAVEISSGTVLWQERGFFSNQNYRLRRQTHHAR